MSSRTADRGAIDRAVRNPVVAVLVLVVVYGALTFANNPGGTLGTDTGIKVATLRVMDRHGTLTPDIGYWAAAWDPAASVHPYRDTRHIGDSYVDVPTVPMIVAAYPLWRVGGYRLALLWPIVGLAACAFIAAALARRIGDTDGWGAFWLVALASPLVLYGLDLWEHTIGVALMAGGMLVLYDVLDRAQWWRGALAGVLFGAAFSMRTEALVYAVVSFAVIGVTLIVRKRRRDVAVVGAGGATGFVAMFLANIALETTLIGQTVRSSRVSGTAGAAGSGLAVRAKEAIVTSFSPFPTFDAYYVVMGVVLGLALVAAAYWGGGRSTRRVAIAAAAIAGFVIVTRLTLNAGFWPGLLATTPLAAVGLARGWDDARTRLVLLLALVPLGCPNSSAGPGSASSACRSASPVSGCSG